MAMARRRLGADAQVSKTLWNIVDQLRTNGTLEGPSSDDLTVAAILEQIAIVVGAPHPTTTKWVDPDSAIRTYIQTADPVIILSAESGDSLE